MNIVGSHTLFLCGGWQQTGKLSENTWLYDVTENTWKQFDKNTIKKYRRAGHTTTNIDDVTLLIYGGEISKETCVLRRLTADVIITKFTSDGNILYLE